MTYPMRDQFSGRIPEGGNAPLFYTLQKLFLQLIHYQTPAQWLQGHWYTDASSQILLRINPIIFMSLSVSLVFYYFCRRYSFKAGFYSLFIYLSSYMLWAYWAEARPYALLVFLTTVQSVILLDMMDRDPRTDGGRLWGMLAGTNILLSLTSVLSMGEIAAVSILYWTFKERDWKKYIGLTVLPIAIILFYYVQAPKYQFYFDSSPAQLIKSNISLGQFFVLFIFLILLSMYSWSQKNSILNFMPGKEILKPVPYIIFMSIVLASCAVVFCLFALYAKQGLGYPINGRYFIYLTPIGVIASTILIMALIRALSKQRLMQGILVGLIGLLLARHFLMTVPKAINSIMTG